MGKLRHRSLLRYWARSSYRIGIKLSKSQWYQINRAHRVADSDERCLSTLLIYTIICDPDAAEQMMLLLPHSKEKLQRLCQAHFGLIPYSGASEPEVIHNLFLRGKLPLKSFHLALCCEELWICSIFLRKACSEAFSENLIPSTPSLTCFPKGARHTQLQELSTYSLSSWPLIRVNLSVDSNCSWQRHGGLKDTQILGVLWNWQHEEALGGSPPETPGWPSQVWQSWVLDRGAPKISWVCCKGMYQNHRQNQEK